ncbi:hypothetical protein TorRG33x02_169720 [Trema orientale]|uniref:Uncharacterized protein n=1 Tax=Trema orientale TaxID=63057 RepID=A0A2P5ENZ6_TREOI|nr:hypothetical protein TorRG33x02_169720 [Trema orientale]
MEPGYVRGGGKHLTDMGRQKIIRGAKMIVIPDSGNADMMPNCDTSDSGIHGDAAEEVGASDVKGGINDSLINKGKHKVFEDGVSTEEMFSIEDTMALGKIFKDNLMSKKNIVLMGRKGVCGTKRHFKRHSPKKPGIVMSPKHAKFFHVQSPHNPRKVGTPKKLDLNAKVSGDSLETKCKILADLKMDCDIRKRIRGDMEVSLNKKLAKSALQARQES